MNSIATERESPEEKVETRSPVMILGYNTPYNLNNKSLKIKYLIIIIIIKREGIK